MGVVFLVCLLSDKMGKMDYKKTESVIIAIVLIFAIIGVVINVSSADLVGQAYSKVSHSAPVPNAVCGDVIIESIVLNTDLKCDNTGLFVGADDVTIDCNGHSISYSIYGLGDGVDNSKGYNNIVIKNCEILDNSNNGRFGIYFNNVNSGSIDNNDITTKHSISGIEIIDSLNIEIKNNNVDVKIKYNNGIRAINTDNSILKNNKVNTDEGAVYGIWLKYCNNPKVEENIITSSGGGDQAIYLLSVNGAVVKNNKIKTLGSSANGIGLIQVTNSKIISNKIDVKSAHGIVTSNYENISVENNEINTQGKFSLGIGFMLGNNVNIKDNEITVLDSTFNGLSIGGSNFNVENNKINSPGISALYLPNSKAYFKNNEIIEAKIAIEIKAGGEHIFENNKIGIVDTDIIMGKGINKISLINQPIGAYELKNVLLNIENDNGQIKYLENVNALGDNLNQDLLISKNSIIVEKEELNKPAKLSFILLFNSFEDIVQNPIALMNGEICSPDICGEVIYEGNQYSYDVEHFTEYSIGEEYI